MACNSWRSPPRAVPKIVTIGTVCSYPEIHALPFREDDI